MKKQYVKPQIISQNIGLHPLLACCVTSKGTLTTGYAESRFTVGGACCCCQIAPGGYNSAHQDPNAGYCICDCSVKSLPDCNYSCALHHNCSFGPGPRC